TSTPGGKLAAAGLRVRARTWAPSASRPATSGRPTLPVAPVTRMVGVFMSDSFPGWGSGRIGDRDASSRVLAFWAGRTGAPPGPRGGQAEQAGGSREASGDQERAVVAAHHRGDLVPG